MLQEYVGWLCPALPNCEDIPSERQQPFHRLEVTPSVIFELLEPTGGVGGGYGGAVTSWMPMPETAVDEDAEAVLGQNDVRLAGQVRAMQPKSVSHGVQGLSHTHLGSGIPILNR